MSVSRVPCDYCQDRGFVESYFASSNSYTPTLQQCPKRCNIAGYTIEVQNRLNKPKHVTESPVLGHRPVFTNNVVPLRKLDDAE